MNFQESINKGLLKKEKIGFEEAVKVLEKSYRSLKSAKVLLKDEDDEGAFKFAYEAMLLAGRALVFSYGLRPRTIGSHKIVIDFAKRVLGRSYEVLVNKFDKMRKKRNYLIYGVGLVISLTEAKNAIKSAEEFIHRTKEFIQKKNPQKKLI